jgi:hypothetical protein
MPPRLGGQGGRDARGGGACTGLWVGFAALQCAQTWGQTNRRAQRRISRHSPLRSPFNPTPQPNPTHPPPTPKIFYHALHGPCSVGGRGLFVDVGANFGWYSVLAGMMGCRWGGGARG